MSGDVQPRKRKDKKRKKEDSTEQVPIQPQPPSPSFQNEDINIHVHKDEGTGGGICAKIVFFLLFSVLVVLIGLIITEHRGLTDLDTAEQESRFSHLFEGWIDNSIGHDEHEEDHLLASAEDEDHGDEAESHEGHEDEDDGHDEADEDEGHDEEEEEEEEGSEEVAQTEEEEEEEEASEEVPQTEEEEEEEEEPEGSEEAPQTEEEEEEEPNVSEVEEDENEDVSELQEADEDEEQNERESVEAEEDDNAVSEEEENAASEEAEEALDRSSETPEEPSKENEEEPDEEKEGDEEGDANSKMVVKIGVGVALLVVAHVVLVRKWKSATPPTQNVGSEEAPDLSRRNTIIVPPTYQEVQRDIQDEEEEYSDEDGEVENEEDATKLRYRELRTTYARSLTPESEGEYQTKPADADNEEYDEEEEEEVEDEEEEEEGEDEEEEESESGDDEKDDDDDLLKRLEARYGKIQAGARKSGNDEEPDEQFSSWKRINVTGDNEPEESESDKQSDAETYEYENITNKEDYKIRQQIDEAHANIQNNTAYALKLFDVLLQNHSSSPRSLYGKAKALDVLADKKRSNNILQKAISTYLHTLTLDNVPDALFEIVAERCINRMRFIGHYNRALEVHQKLIDRFPKLVKYQNQLVVSYLTMNKINKARGLLQEILSKHPNDGLALVHYGFILKTVDNKLEESVFYLRKGISTEAPGVIDGRFYFHLGDTLSRLGKTQEAMKIYEDGVKHNLFLSKYQRSLYNIPRLKGQPWWKKLEIPYSDLFIALEKNWEKIRDEGISVLNKNGQFQSESENLKDTGDWKQFELFARGQKNVNNCKKCPITCQIIESIPDARGCKRGQTKFSVMHPGTHVWPHCGPTNCRLRVHLGLKVPSHTYIRVADEIRSWEEGKILIFDDSFEHEVWHNGTSFRLVLIVDVWHPELSSVEKKSLSPI